MLDLQKATFSKRISAFLFDIIAMFIVVVGVLAIASSVTKYDVASANFEKIYSDYEQFYIYDAFNNEFGSEKKYTNSEIHELLAKEENLELYGNWNNTQYQKMYEDLSNNEEAMSLYSQVVVLTILNITVSILAGFLVLEFIVPLILKNGQTIGKKIFGVALMRVDGVKVSPIQMFIRTILGKYTIETMIPVLVVVCAFLNLLSSDTVLFAFLILVAILVANVVIYFKSDRSSLLHDEMAMTIAVDLQSQMIFNTEEELIAYKEEQAAEAVGKQGYGSESLYSVYSSKNTVQTLAEIESSSNEEHNSDQSYSSVTFGDAILANSDVDPEVEQANLEANTDSEAEVALEEAENTDDVQADEASEVTEEGSYEEAVGAESDNEPCEDEEKEEEIEESSENDASDSTEADNADETEREKASDSEQE